MKTWQGYEKGVNLGGWLSQCDHTKERYDNFIVESDVATIASWGADHVRLPIDYDLVETVDGEYKESGFGYIQTAIDWCEKYKLNLVLDLHKTFGYSFDDGEQEAGFFDSEQYQERFYRLWEQLATRFGKYYDRVAFELLNEVTLPEYCETWNRIADTCIGRIRKIAPEVTILVGGYWNNSVSAVKDIKLSSYDNIILNFHCYEPLLFTHQGAHWIPTMDTSYRIPFNASRDEYIEGMEANLPSMVDAFKIVTEGMDIITEEYFERLFAEAISFADKLDRPLYCGESGVINLASAEDTLDWYVAFETVLKKYKISRAAWSFKEMDFGLNDDHMKPTIEAVKKVLFE